MVQQSINFSYPSSSSIVSPCGTPRSCPLRKLGRRAARIGERAGDVASSETRFDGRVTTYFIDMQTAEEVLSKTYVSFMKNWSLIQSLRQVAKIALPIAKQQLAQQNAALV